MLGDNGIIILVLTQYPYENHLFQILFISKYQISKDVGVNHDQNYLQKIKTGS